MRAVYTGSHFAVTLLECGPHVTGCDSCRGHYDSELICPVVMEYRVRVHRCFIELHPDLPITMPYSSPANEWSMFWHLYRAWVET